ncbi:hypothetical protein BSKO_06926 [Bryopsis sp. KO-2023]|nr:hypothetical protein BSKO_06926 [Bryopsis sp. KO-2023]
MLTRRQAKLFGAPKRDRASLSVVCGVRENAPKIINRRALIGGSTVIAVGIGGAQLLQVGSGMLSQKKTVVPQVVEPTESEAPGSKILDAIQHFVAGGVAGSLGATAVYPIDLVKTRMQNERTSADSEPRFKNGWECFLGVLREEGPLALYQGLVPQVVGVWPEKAVKLAANDFARSIFMNPSGVVPLPLQILSGGFGGMCQIVFTNPLEIVKVRLQVVEAARDGKPPSPIEVVKNLGLEGLYKGWTVCAARDVPFSMIYFPTFALLKGLLSTPGATDLSPTTLFLAGLLAGVPAAYLVTPMDVIKTRVQVEPRKGEEAYAGPIDCLQKILANEGPGALFKGGFQRVLRSAPQFGVTLLVYELINRSL